ncbi:hypothetical protein [Chromobacterium haemolyticum]|uniref:hypothetical protein n=1 Tax=Chromobacterium TaxID=535 RepID=UPI00307CE1B5
MTLFYRWMAGCAGGLMLGPALAAPQWTVSKPYPDKPLQVASLDGEATVGRSRFPVMLELACRADSPPLRMSLHVSDQLGGWDVRPFEGPGGLGERRKLKLGMAGLRRGTDSHFAGWYEADGRFVFEWPSQGEFFAWQSATHKELLVTIDGASRKHGKLEARFTLPPSSQAALAVALPCMGKK